MPGAEAIRADAYSKYVEHRIGEGDAAVARADGRVPGTLADWPGEREGDAVQSVFAGQQGAMGCASGAAVARRHGPTARRVCDEPVDARAEGNAAAETVAVEGFGEELGEPKRRRASQREGGAARFARPRRARRTRPQGDDARDGLLGGKRGRSGQAHGVIVGSPRRVCQTAPARRRNLIARKSLSKTSTLPRVDAP